MENLIRDYQLNIFDYPVNGCYMLHEWYFVNDSWNITLFMFSNFASEKKMQLLTAALLEGLKTILIN